MPAWAGEGVLKASDIVAEVAFRAGLDVKKSEIHGMSQRGGSVTSDVRFGEKVYSPMVPPGEADYLVVLSPDQVEPNRWQIAGRGQADHARRRSRRQPCATSVASTSRCSAA